MKKVNIAIIGAGRAAQLHLDAYKKVYGIDINIKGIFDTDTKRAISLSNAYQIKGSFSSIEEVLNDPEIDVIDICTPPFTHPDLIIDSLNHEKHVICEKPLCGYFGEGTTDGKTMFKEVQKQLDRIEAVVKQSKKKFFYAENFIYAPAIVKAAEIITKKKSKILFAKGEESLAGSSSAVANLWNKTGGGSLIRVGCHPLSAIIYLKRLNKIDIEIVDVKADISTVTTSLSKKQHRFIKAQPVDVEDTAVVTLTFSDNTKALIIACDTRLGGSKNYVELYCNDTFMECNLTLSDMMKTYFLDEEGLEDVEISEMLQTKTGWNNPFIEDDVIRGYTNEMQDFMECIAYNRKPKSDFDIAKKTIDTIYRAYTQK
ncbi:MAG: Gfo/Idh/MocA family oxidoreductase [Erysipelotrichaceae bacterium]|nr:Gfo/Idh/MocA family oxidoreductase [Erysipelotrichaceae bacterium]